MRRKICAVAGTVVALACVLLPQAIAEGGVVSANKTDPGAAARVTTALE